MEGDQKIRKFFLTVFPSFSGCTSASSLSCSNSHSLFGMRILWSQKWIFIRKKSLLKIYLTRPLNVWLILKGLNNLDWVQQDFYHAMCTYLCVCFKDVCSENVNSLHIVIFNLKMFSFLIIWTISYNGNQLHIHMFFVFLLE